jgi:hypothetical protein
MIQHKFNTPIPQIITPFQMSYPSMTMEAANPTVNRETIDMVRSLTGQNHRKLGTPPNKIVDQYSVVTGDVFHFTKRPVTPKDHEVNKEYYNRLTRAWNEFDGGVLRNDDGLSDEEISKKWSLVCLTFKRGFHMSRYLARYCSGVSVLSLKITAR